MCPPADPPVRRSARVLVVDGDRRILLFQVGVKERWGAGAWITPGGGIEPGESDVTAARRELAEETGHRVPAADLVGPVWHRRVHGPIGISDETFFLLRTAPFVVDTAGGTPWEQEVGLHHRWWPLPEIAAAVDEVFAPNRLAVLATELLDAPDPPPLLEVGW